MSNGGGVCWTHALQGFRFGLTTYE